MSVIESIGVAFFLIMVVFLVLCCLWLCIRFFSFAVCKLENTLLVNNEHEKKN